jgi:hypothetical protein
LDGEEINISKSLAVTLGWRKNQVLREAAGALNRRIIDSLQRINPKAKVITMGDLNDGLTIKA